MFIELHVGILSQPHVSHYCGLCERRRFRPNQDLDIHFLVLVHGLIPIPLHIVLQRPFFLQQHAPVQEVVLENPMDNV